MKTGGGGYNPPWGGLDKSLLTSVAYVGLSRQQRGLERLKLAQR